MRKLVFILLAFIAAATFIRAFEKPGDNAVELSADIPTTGVLMQDD